MNAPFHKIIWAVDPYQETPASQKRCISAIRALVKPSSRPIEIQPVHVLQLQSVFFPLELLEESNLIYMNEIKALLTEQFKGIRLPHLLPPDVLPFQTSSKRASVEALNKYALNTKADLIVAGTHGRKGLKRLFLGSFSESLLLHSRVPVLTVNTHSGALIKEYRHILFPSDFEEGSEEAFEHLLNLASQLQAKVTLFHLIQETPLLQTSAQYRQIQDTYLRIARADAESSASSYAKKAEARKVAFELALEISREPIADRILSLARAKEIQLIAMPARKGPITMAFAGSTTRQVVRGAFCPTWVFRASAAPAATQAPQAA